MDGVDHNSNMGVQAVAAQAGFGERRFGAVNWLGLWTLYVKEVRRFLKVAFQTVIAPVISTLLFLIVFTQAFGGLRGLTLTAFPLCGVPGAGPHHDGGADECVHKFIFVADPDPKYKAR